MVSLSDEAFSILGSETDKYSSCLGFIATHFQNEEECPKYNNGDNICYYSKYIKVGFYGGTTETVSKGRCGLEGIQNIIQSGNSAVDGIVNIGVARSFGVVSKELIKRGYKEGFHWVDCQMIIGVMLLQIILQQKYSKVKLIDYILIQESLLLL
jgi:hypothetical protein